MTGGKNARRRTNLRPIADRDFNNVENDAVEIEECSAAKPDVGAVIAEERRPDFGAPTDAGEPLLQERRPVRRQRHVLASQPTRRCGKLGLYIRIALPR